METNDILGYINGVKLSIDGKANLTKYSYKTKISIGYKIHWLEKIIKSKDDALLFASICAFKGFTFQKLDESLEKDFIEWKYRLEKPSLVLDEVFLESLIDLKELIKETSAGPKLLSDLLGNRISLITFLYILSVTNCHTKWSSIHWKIYKNRFDIYQNTVKIPDVHIRNFAKYLRKQFTSAGDSV